MTEDIAHYQVAIIGGGPAGLSAALRLKQRGIARIVVLERDSEAGGVPRHCGHPPFGLREFGRLLSGPAYAQRLRQAVAQANIEIRLRHSVTALLPDGLVQFAAPSGPGAIRAERVILAMGARETPRSTRLVSGVRPLGILNTGALQAFVNLQGLVPFRRPLIVGTELVSLSALSTCRKHGINPVAMLEQNPQATARWPFTLFPRLLSIPVHYGADIVTIAGRERVESVSVKLADGSQRQIDCDGVLFTGKFLPEASLIRSSQLDFDLKSGGPMIDQHGRCSDPSYFAAGNLLRAIETAGWSFREGTRIADHVADDLMDGPKQPLCQIAIRPGAGIKYVVPQRLSLYGDSVTLPDLQLRLSEPGRGRLSLGNGLGELATQSLNSRPERRILFRARQLTIPASSQTLQLEIR